MYPVDVWAVGEVWRGEWGAAAARAPCWVPGRMLAANTLGRMLPCGEKEEPAFETLHAGMHVPLPLACSAHIERGVQPGAAHHGAGCRVQGAWPPRRLRGCTSALMMQQTCGSLDTGSIWSSL